MGDPGCENFAVVDPDDRGEFGDPGYKNPVVLVVSKETGELGDPGCENVAVVDQDDRGELGDPGYKNPVLLVLSD